LHVFRILPKAATKLVPCAHIHRWERRKWQSALLPMIQHSADGDYRAYFK
jgi:hypothetical protein